jgi:hypothetical protein
MAPAPALFRQGPDQPQVANTIERTPFGTSSRIVVFAVEPLFRSPVELVHNLYFADQSFRYFRRLCFQ